MRLFLWRVQDYRISMLTFSTVVRAEMNVLVQVHIALDDQTGDRGGLQFVPGSHRSMSNTMLLAIVLVLIIVDLYENYISRPLDYY